MAGLRHFDRGFGNREWERAAGNSEGFLKRGLFRVPNGLLRRGFGELGGGPQVSRNALWDRGSPTNPMHSLAARVYERIYSEVLLK